MTRTVASVLRVFFASVNLSCRGLNKNWLRGMTAFDERWCLSTRIECSGRIGKVLIKLPMERLDGTQSLSRLPRI
jgi:hypothetical protein